MKIIEVPGRKFRSIVARAATNGRAVIIDNTIVVDYNQFFRCGLPLGLRAGDRAIIKLSEREQYSASLLEAYGLGEKWAEAHPLITSPLLLMSL